MKWKSCFVIYFRALSLICSSYMSHRRQTWRKEIQVIESARKRIAELQYDINSTSSSRFTVTTIWPETGIDQRRGWRIRWEQE